MEPERGTHQHEFRELVEALHAAGLGVVLDVVFNHTAESGADGPIINFKGLVNDVFYLLDPADRRRYQDFLPRRSFIAKSEFHSCLDVAGRLGDSSHELPNRDLQLLRDDFNDSR